MFAEAGRRALLVDCDPQASLSEAFGWGEDRVGERLEDLLAHPDAIQRYAPPVALQADVAPRLAWREQLRIIPATRRLRRVPARRACCLTSKRRWRDRGPRPAAHRRPRATRLDAEPPQATLVPRSVA
jgi:cellulose biosynthesis protein BcsQ